MNRQEIVEAIMDMSERELETVAKALKAMGQMKKNKYPFMGNFLSLQIIPSEYEFSCSMPITRELLNPYRIVYGGVTAMLADMAMGWMLEDLIDTRDKVVTIDMNVNYHNPGRGKELIAHCSIVHRAQNIMQASCCIVNDKGETIVTATGTFFHLIRSIKDE
ncbi:MAG TPA: PaaI family thioesterase [Bacillota bacterium]|nr:PaaI family thioesterase [Bacillota bacterium]